MAVTAASTLTSNAPNYQGVATQLAPNRTPLMNILTAMGKNRDSGLTRINSHTWAPAAAAQPSRSETNALTAPSETTYASTALDNTKQIFDQACEVSFRKVADTQVQATTKVDGMAGVVNEAMAVQVQRHLAKMWLDMEYCIINGTYTTETGTRGLLSALSTNEIAGGTAQLTEAMVEAMVQSMAAQTNNLNNLLILCNAYQLQKINELYRVVPADRTVGGARLRTIYTSQAEINLIYNPVVPTDDILCVDLEKLTLEWTPTDGQRIWVGPLAELGAGFRRYLYADMGIGYETEVNIGGITNLATSA